MDFAIQANHRVKIKESKKHQKYLYLARELKKIEVIMIPTVTGVLGTVPKKPEKNWGKKNQRKNRDYPEICTDKIGQNIQYSPRALRRLAATQSPVKITRYIWYEKLSKSIFMLIIIIIRHDWVGEVIRGKLCQNFKFHHTNK